VHLWEGQPLVARKLEVEVDDIPSPVDINCSSTLSEHKMKLPFAPMASIIAGSESHVANVAGGVNLVESLLLCRMS
jgi:hypothetical protein